jgi:hypothetical protein
MESNLTFTQGKYFGQKLEDVAKKDPDYLFFVYRKSGFDGVIKNWIWEHREEIQEYSRLLPQIGKSFNK